MNVNNHKCSVCGCTDQELRPYGKDFAMVCYECGMKDMEQTRISFNAIIDAYEGCTVFEIGSELGPRPISTPAIQ